jgi:hypothetical protein
VPDLRVASRSKTLVVAAASAAIGAGIATIAVFALRKDPVHLAPTEPASVATAVTALDQIETAKPPPAPAPDPAPAPAAVPAPPPANRAPVSAENAVPAPAPAPAPASEPAVLPTTVDDLAQRFATALAPCFLQPQTGTRIDAITIVPKGAGARPYFATNTVLTSAEKGCIINALKPLAEVPPESVLRLHVDHDGLEVLLRK